MKITKLLAALLVLCMSFSLFVACDMDEIYTPTTTDVNQATQTEMSMTIGQKNALESAESYLKYSSFSREGLINQLEFEGFEEDDIIFAVDHVKVDWNEQCYKTAMSYLEYSSFSKQGLIDQLEFEGFTDEQIAYAIEKVGY